MYPLGSKQNNLEWRNEKPQEAKPKESRVAKQTLSSGECLKWQMLRSQMANATVSSGECIRWAANAAISNGECIPWVA